MGKSASYHKKIEIAAPAIHFILSFIFERFVLIPKDYASVAFSVPMSMIFSTQFEQIVCYCISKIIAGIIIFLVWKLLFLILNKRVCGKSVLLFGAIWIIVLFCVAIEWPGESLAGDNIITYSYAIRLVPEYWHSFYQTCLYVASMMVLPHPFSICILQVTLFVFSIAYLYYRIENCELLKGKRLIKWFSLLLFFFRDMPRVCSNPERVEYNTSFLLIFLTIIVFDIIEKRRRSDFHRVLISLFAIFLAVYRTEGIIVGIGSLIVWNIFVYKDSVKRRLCTLLVILLCYYAFSLPLKMGEIKYYGSDYSIINTFASLKNILNSEKSNLSYAGAAEDLNAIEEIVPLEIIEEYEAIGYRSLNYSMGRADINQSLAGKEKSSAYMNGYRRIILHNIPIYLKTQTHFMLSALGTGVGFYEEEFKGTHKEITYFERDMWKTGWEDATHVKGYSKWQEISFRNSTLDIIKAVKSAYSELLTKSYIYACVNLLEILTGIFIVIKSFIELLKKRYGFLGIGLIALLMNAYLGAIWLAMPVGANIYMHAYLYCMYALILIYFGACLNKE